MTEALHSFLVSVSCIIGIALFLPGVETLVRRLRRDPEINSPEIVRLTPAHPNRRSNF